MSPDSLAKAKEYGTFKDCVRAPIHGWFQYPAGYSYKLVEAKAQQYGLDSSDWVLDPFVGCGTTSVVLKQIGINSIGIDSHPFVFWVARVKTYWEYDMIALEEAIRQLWAKLTLQIDKGEPRKINMSILPELVHKCYSVENLARLVLIKEALADLDVEEHIKDFLKLALTATLRLAAKAGTGWPYIAPTKYHERVKERNALEAFTTQAWRMYSDLRLVITNRNSNEVKCELILGDAREHQPTIGKETIDLVITSPPYLNNYDYADRTRLEMYFFGHASTWGDITTHVRNKLMMCATTQINRSAFNGERCLDDALEIASPQIYNELHKKVDELRAIRLYKGGKKSYDIMVAGYFSDMLKVLKRIYRVLKKGHDFVLVLGDSAPYGVYIPTEEYLGQMALGIGYSKYNLEVLRQRGEKWPGNPQRHKVKLKESILTITK